MKNININLDVDIYFTMVIYQPYFMQTIANNKTTCRRFWPSKMLIMPCCKICNYTVTDSCSQLSYCTESCSCGICIIHTYTQHTIVHNNEIVSKGKKAILVPHTSIKPVV